MYSKEIYNWAIKWIENQGYGYEVDEDKGLIRCQLRIVEDPEETVTVYTEVREDYFFINCYIDDLNVSSNNMAKVCELLSRINMGYIYPQYVLSYNEHYIYCRNRSIVSDAILENGVIEWFGICFDNVVKHIIKHKNAILAVALGVQTPEAAYESVEE